MKILFYLLIIFSVALISCSKDDNNPTDTTDNTPTANVILEGDGYTGAKITLFSCEAEYIPFPDVTSIKISGITNTDSVLIYVRVRGKAPITMDWDETNASVDMFITKNGGTPLYATLNGTTKITEYGEVGKLIKGEFLGILQNYPNANTINVVGTFSARRLVDDTD